LSSKNLLIIAYHFPPIQGSTGTIRTLAFSRYLEKLGWQVSVLTVSPDAYEAVLPENVASIPENVSVIRAPAFDTRKKLSIRGRYPLILALPDRWQSWIVGTARRAQRILETSKPDLILSTYPIPSAHAIGYLLHRRHNLPWVAEFRDPMLQQNYPDTLLERWAFGRLEKLVFRNATNIIVTTNGCKRFYRQRYPDFDENRLTVISNGYDPSVFDSARKSTPLPPSDQLVILHSGLLYPRGRNPSAFFEALRSLLNKGFFAGRSIEFRFRASGGVEDYVNAVDEYALNSLVKFMPQISYVDAIREMQSVDALMLFQGASCNDQIPAKAYEYFYCQKPILAFTDPDGDTGELLRHVGIGPIARLEDSTEIELAIKQFVEGLETGKIPIIPLPTAQEYSREALTERLNEVLLKAVNEK